jgi:hypothetical protein
MIAWSDVQATISGAAQVNLASAVLLKPGPTLPSSDMIFWPCTISVSGAWD